MTFTGEFEGSPEAGKGPSYPTLFGVTLTPTVIGALMGLGGLALAGYLFTLMVSPTLTEAQRLSDSIAQKESDLAQKSQLVQQVQGVVDSLNRAKTQNQDVRSLFSNEAALDTLLLDLNRVINQNGAQLLKFEPDAAASVVISDGSLGPDLNGKLRRQVTNVSFQGTFSQTLAIFQSIDRLQTLLVIQNLAIDAKDIAEDTKGKEAAINPKLQTQLTSTFKLVAYVPVDAPPAPAPAVSPATPPQ
jgi:type IV pilus assembly protein PilO